MSWKHYEKPAKVWRKERDSNPRSRLTRDNGFRDRRLQPLGHPSTVSQYLKFIYPKCSGKSTGIGRHWHRPHPGSISTGTLESSTPRILDPLNPQTLGPFYFYSAREISGVSTLVFLSFNTASIWLSAWSFCCGSLTLSGR